MKIKRYDFVPDCMRDCFCDMEETENGQYVKFSDYEKVIKGEKVIDSPFTFPKQTIWE